MLSRCALLLIVAGFTAFAGDEPYPIRQFCDLPGGCRPNPSGNPNELAGAAFGAAIILGSLWWRKRDSK